MSIKKIVSLTALIATATFAGASSNAHAFSISAAGALNISNQSVSPSPTLTTTGAGTTVGFGVLGSLDVLPGFAAELGALYIPRKVNTNTNAGTTISSLTANSLEVPLLLRFTALPIVSFGLGVYYAAILGDLTYTLGGSDTPRSASAAGYNTSDFGFVGSIAASLPLLPTLSIFADARYLFGLVDVDTSPITSTSFRDVQILAGVTFGL